MQIGSTMNLNNTYLTQARSGQQKDLNNIAAQRAISGIDSANMVIADNLRMQSSTLEQGVSNSNDAIAALQIVDHSLNSLSETANRINELNTSKNSAVLNSDQKNMIDREVNALQESMKSVIETTNFNGKNLFNQELSFHTGDSLKTLNVQDISKSIQEISGNNLDDFLKQVNSLRADIGSTQKALLSEIENSLKQIPALKNSESQLQNNDIANNVNELNKNILLQNANIFTQIHERGHITDQVTRLLA